MSFLEGLMTARRLAIATGQDPDCYSIPKRRLPRRLRNDYVPRFPNPPDLRFDYAKVLIDANNARQGMAKPDDISAQKKIAVVGAGVAGLCTALELARCGYRNIVVFEAGDRTGGRTYSVQMAPGDTSVAELGAMRVPFFDPQERPEVPNSIFSFYARNQADYNMQFGQFPNAGEPGTQAGLWFDRELTVWEGGDEIPNEDIQEISRRFGDFAYQETLEASSAWHHPNPDVWKNYWDGIREKYQDISFYDGMKEALDLDTEQMKIFGKVGVGSGSFDPLFNVSMLEIYSLIPYGFEDEQQLIASGGGASGTAYLGVESLANCFLDVRTYMWDVVSQMPVYLSLNQVLAANAGLRLSHQVREIIPGANDQLIVEYDRGGVILREEFHHVIVTTNSRAIYNDIRIDNSLIEQRDSDAIHGNHMTTSSKIFYRSDRAFWKNPDGSNIIPDVTLSDEFVRGAYFWSDNLGGNGMLALSYTWEDDSDRQVGLSDAELADRCLSELDRIYFENGLSPEPNFIRNNVDHGRGPEVIHWTKEPNYYGAFRLVEPGGNQSNDKTFFWKYNQRKSAETHLYFAGECVAMNGGWIEDTLRSALDSVIWLNRIENAEFLNNVGNIYPYKDISDQVDGEDACSSGGWWGHGHPWWQAS